MPTSSQDTLHRRVTAVTGRAARCSFSCAAQSLLCSAGEVVVLRVTGEVDLCTLPAMQAALGQGLAARPAHLLVDLTAMTFCCARGLDLLTQTAHITAGQATSFAISGVSPQITRIWALGWDDDLPNLHRSTAAAMATIPGCQKRPDIPA